MDKESKVNLRRARKIVRDISKSRQVKAIYMFGSYATRNETPL